MVIKAIFFDTSNTLYHCPKLKQLQRTVPVEMLAKIKNISLDEAKKLFKETRERLKETMVHVPKVAVMMELGITRIQFQEELAEINTKGVLKPDKELNEILSNLHSEYKLGIITNILKKFVLNILDSMEVSLDNFDYFVTVDNTSNSKPHEEPFLKAIELAGCEQEECVYVGDSLTKDMIPAKRAGMKTVWITNDEMEDEHVDQKVKSIYDIISAIKMM